MRKYNWKILRAFVAALAFALPVFIFAIPARAAVKLNLSSVNLCVGDTAKLKLKGTSKKVSWKSGSPGIVKVAKSGTIRAVRVGDAIVTAHAGGKDYRCKVHANKTFKVDKTSISINDNAKLTAFLSVNGAVNASVADKKICSVTFGAWDGDYMPMTVKPKKTGSTTVTFTNSANSESCTLKVKVTGVPIAATFEKPAISTGGKAFVVGSNTMNFSFKLNHPAKKVVFKVYGPANEVAQTFEFTDVGANKPQSVVWNGLDADGRVMAGTFKYAVVADGTKTSGGKAVVYAESPFGVGDGSPSNPFRVTNLDELRRVRDFNGACFAQDADIDFNYDSFEPLFDDKDPFSGTYVGKCDGAQRKMLNLYGYKSVFGTIGVNGTVRDVTMEKCVLNTSGSLLAYRNAGSIEHCSVEGIVLCNDGREAALLAAENSGEIRDCTVLGSLTMSAADVSAPMVLYAGAVAVRNTGMIIGCSSSVEIVQQMQISGYAPSFIYEAYGGGIVADNAVGGFVTQCWFSGNIDAQISVIDPNANVIDAGQTYAGYIAGVNRGYMGECANAGSQRELEIQGAP